MASSAFSLTLTLPADGFEITQGDPVPGGLSRDVHYFCPRCMTWMFTRPTGMDWMVSLRPTMLDDHAWFAPYVETYVSEKLRWATTPARHSFDTFPAMDAWDPLVAEYADSAQRPV